MSLWQALHLWSWDLLPEPHDASCGKLDKPTGEPHAAGETPRQPQSFIRQDIDEGDGIPSAAATMRGMGSLSTGEIVLQPRQKDILENDSPWVIFLLLLCWMPFC